MKKLFTLFSLFCALICFSWTASAQCVGASQWPSGTQTVDAAGTVLNITTCNYADEYSSLDGIVMGNTYEFTSSNSTDYLTLRDGTDGSSNILAEGTTPISWTATISGNAYLHIHADASCLDDGSICRTTTNQCTSCTPPAAPDNDLCMDALDITNGAVMMASTAAATADDAPTPCSGGGGGGSCVAGGDGLTTDGTEGVWYKYTSTVPGESITVSTEDAATSFDTEIQVFQGPCGSLTCIGGDDDGGDGIGNSFDSRFCWTSDASASEAPIEYFIYIDGHNGATGDVGVTLIVEAPLPIELISFDGEAMDKTNMLKWSTASEENTEMFIVERSIDGTKDWTKVSSIAATGWSTSLQRYEVEDANPLALGYYRLRSVDFDGSEQISDLVVLERKRNDFGVTSLFPNPTRAQVTIQFEAVKQQNIDLIITDLTGRVIQSVAIAAENGINTLDLDLSAYAKGVYFITMFDGNTKSVERIIKN